MKQTASEPPKTVSEAGKIGLSWGSSSGEASGLINDNYLAADGIENVIRVLEDLEDEKFRDVDFIELNVCSGGCVGGVLNVENPYVARTKLYRIRKHLPVSMNHIEEIGPEMLWDTPLEYVPVLKLDEDMGRGNGKNGPGGRNSGFAGRIGLRILRCPVLPRVGGRCGPGSCVGRRLCFQI